MFQTFNQASMFQTMNPFYWTKKNSANSELACDIWNRYRNFNSLEDVQNIFVMK